MQEDQSMRELKGALIPRKEKRQSRVVVVWPPLPRVVVQIGKATMMVTTVVVFLLLGVSGYGMVEKANLALLPTISVIDPYTKEAAAMKYGPHIALAQRSFYTDTRDVFIEQELTFIEIDVTGKQLRLFKKGVLLQSAEILSVGQPGSWWDVPSGLYQIIEKDTEKFTNIAQVLLPWQITFQSNFIIHGWPTYPDGTAVTESFAGGGITLSTEDAERLFRNVTVGIPVLVHAEEGVAEIDDFVYEAPLAGVSAPYYFVADVTADTVLLSSDSEAAVPIASLTKLMTAVVAAEQLDLDSEVLVGEETMVTSIIPRLADRETVSMYTLLQLLLVESSNEAAELMAAEIGREAFIAAMNDKAMHLGMEHTQFADVSGLSSENMSSLKDLYTLVKYIYKHKKFIFELTEKAALSSVYVDGDFAGLVNFNEVKDMDNFVGGKVGETLAAGQTSISLHEIILQGERRVVVVELLGATERSKDVLFLLNHITETYNR